MRSSISVIYGNGRFFRTSTLSESGTIEVGSEEDG